MTTDSPKGPEREARPEEPLRQQVFNALWKTFEDEGGRFTPGTAERLTDAALAPITPELDRLTAEVKWEKGEKFEAHACLGRFALGIDQALGVSGLSPQDAAKAAADLKHERDAVLVEVSRLREQLAAQPKLPATAVDDLVEFWHNNKHEGFLDDAARAVIAKWGVSSSEVEAPQPQRVFVGAHSLKETCRFCDAPGAVASDTATDRYHFVGVEAPSEAPEPDEFAMTLRPQLQANSKLEQNLDEGRPSGSERLAPRSDEAEVRALLIHPAAWSGLVQWLDSRGIYVQTAGDPEGIPCWSMGVRDLNPPDAAQAARSEATPEGSVPRTWATGSPAPDESVTKVVAKNDVTFERTSWGYWRALPPEGNDRDYSWSQPNDLMTMTEVPSPSLRKEGGDRG